MVCWVPDYRDVLGNKKTDRATKKAVGRLLTEKYVGILLACAQRVCIEVYRITIVN